MSNNQQVKSGTEREQLAHFLDLQRAAILRKVEGVSDEDLRRKMTPTGLSLLGLVKHLGTTELGLFRYEFAGEDMPFPWNDDDPEEEFRIEPNETTAEILAFYREQIERSRQIVAEHELDEIGRNTPSQAALRWFVVHMIEETARHAGHMDIMREAIDGSTGV
jgi:uncharacterized damage-inducible protein DinB